jgi:outer membrane protein insertion porin family
VERPILSLHTGTYFQGTEASVEGRLGLTNAAGRGEQVTLSIEKGSEDLGEVSASLTKPRLCGRPWTGSLDAHGRTRSWAASSSFDERSLGGGLRLGSDDGRHALGYSSAWRTLADGTRHASGAVKAQAGHSLKSAVSYTGRAGGTVGVGPSESGAVASYSLEVAGLGWSGGGAGGSSLSSLGLVRHVRHQASGAWHAPLAALAPSLFGSLGAGAAWGETVGFHLTATVGLLVPWGGGGEGGSGARGGRRAAAAATSLSDRFFLGGFGGLSGSSTLRGFGLRGVGPVDARHVPGPSPVFGGGGGAPSTSSSPSSAPPPPIPDPRPWDFLGGDAAGSLTASARVRLPWTWARETGIFGHAFVNGGGLALLGGGNGRGGSGGRLTAAADAVAAAAAGARWSAGVGLVWPTVAGNLEVDWVRVLKAASSDVSRSGLSVGFTPRS